MNSRDYNSEEDNISCKRPCLFDIGEESTFNHVSKTIDWHALISFTPSSILHTTTSTSNIESTSLNSTVPYSPINLSATHFNTEETLDVICFTLNEYLKNCEDVTLTHETELFWKGMFLDTCKFQFSVFRSLNKENILIVEGRCLEVEEEEGFIFCDLYKRVKALFSIKT